MTENIDNRTIEALQGRDVLAAALCRHAEPRSEAGGMLRFTCPFHPHKRPEKAHLRIEDTRGRAVAICDSYGVAGDVFAVLRELEGAQRFPEQVRKAAEIAGTPLPERRGAYGGKRKAAGRGNAGNGFPCACGARGDVFAPSAAKLSHEQEKALADAVGRLAADSDALARHAAALGLPAERCCLVRIWSVRMTACWGYGLTGGLPMCTGRAMLRGSGVRLWRRFGVARMWSRVL